MDPWGGATQLGDGWAVYEGPTGDSRAHRHVALQIAIGLRQAVTIVGEHETVRGDVVVVRAGAKHRLLPVVGGVRCVFVEVERAGVLAKSTADIERGGGELGRALRETSDVGAALAELAPPRKLDARLARALATLAESPSGNGAIASAAEAAHISVSRLRALAASDLEAPLAQWRLWRMLGLAARAIASGSASFAAAAAEAGFADQAHLTRTMARFFGITPTVAARSLRRA